MYQITILSSTSVADNMIVVETTKPRNFTFSAGQFVQLLIPKADGSIKPTAYSIASMPSDEHLLFLVKVYKDGVASTFLENKTNIGTTIGMSEVKGHFTVREDASSHLFVATGSGMAPMMSMIRDELVYKKSTKEMLLYFGVRHMTDLFWQTELEALADEYPNFSCHITLSQPEDAWPGLRGRVTAHITPAHVTYDTYLCGSAPMVMEIRKLLLSHGADAKHIHFEIF